MAIIREDTVRIGFDIQSDELSKLRAELDDLRKSLGADTGTNAYSDLTENARKATGALDDLKQTARSVKPDGVDKMTDGLQDTSRQGKSAHKQLQKIARVGMDKAISGARKLGDALGKVAVKAGAALAKSTAVAAAGVGAVVTQAVNSYAEYEQLTGGIDTLFGQSAQSVDDYVDKLSRSKSQIRDFQRANGLVVDGIIGPKTMAAIEQSYALLADSSEVVMANADNAYKTAGLSANEYMETVTSFSASLINSLGGDTAKAAELADMAIVDMADNANKMGTDVGSIQDAYQGFAKQNYDMLDNLRLGYGGTKSEMERLLKDAQELTGKKYDISSFADIAEAIHAVQTEMGISGTTALEASTTISGSMASFKAAWSNTLTSLVTGGDSFDRCVDDLVESAATMGQNLMPAIISALAGAGALIERLAPILEAELPGLVDTLSPPLLAAATALVKGLIVALPGIISALVDEIPAILGEIWDAIREAFGDTPAVDALSSALGWLGDFFATYGGKIKKLVPAILGLVGAFKVLKKLRFLGSLFGNSSGSGGLLGAFRSLGDMKLTTALKGIANLAIIFGGLALITAALMKVAPHMAQLSDLQSLGKVALVIAGVGVVGSALSELAGLVGKIPVSTILKGVTNIATVMVGLGALAALLMWVAPYMDELSGEDDITTLLTVISAVGLIGSALAGLSGAVGLIPVSTVLKGLIGVALALVGITAVVAAFGALSQIDGLSDFIATGGALLTQVFNVIGQCAGALIGGMGEGVSASLPAIGTNLAAFAANVQPMFDTFSGVDVSGFNSFLSAFSSFILVMTGEKVLSWLTGATDYAALGTQLTSFAANASGFFDTVATLPEAAFTNTTALFNALANVSALPESGGVAQWFAGDSLTSMSSMASALPGLGASVAAFFSALGENRDFTLIPALFSALAGVSAMPTEGGLMSWFMGDATASLNSTAAQLPLLGYRVSAFFSGLGSRTDFSAIPNLFTALSSVSSMPAEGGFLSWFGGDASTGLANVSGQLPGVATNIATFFANLGGITDFTPISGLFNTLGSIEIDASAADKGIFGWGTSQFEALGTGLSNFATNAATFFSTVNGMSTEGLSSFVEFMSSAGGIPAALAGVNAQLGTTLSNMATLARTGMATLRAIIASGLTLAVAAIAAKYSAFYSSGASIMTGLMLGMQSKRSALVATARSIASAIQSAFNVSMDINSPSGVMERSGKYVGQGLVQGMDSTGPDIRAASLRMGSATMGFGGYSPETSSVSTVYNSGGNSSTYTASPVFNLTISGTQDDRALARKVQRYIAEALKSTFESMERKTAPTMEV